MKDKNFRFPYTGQEVERRNGGIYPLILIFALAGGEWEASRPIALPSRHMSLPAWSRRLGGPHSRSGSLKEVYLLPGYKCLRLAQTCSTSLIVGTTYKNVV